MQKVRFPWIPRHGTAPFCPSEVKGSVAVDPQASFLKNMLRYFGPGILISVGYMDPGNWATDIEAGSRFGYNLLFIVLLASFAAIVLQCLSLKLGIATGKDLARLSRDLYKPWQNRIQWMLAEIGITACDLAEVLGGALAFHLLFGCSMMTGVLLTAVDTLLILGMKGRGFRQLEAIILSLVLTIGVCFFVELILVKPDWPLVIQGFIPSVEKMSTAQAWYIAIGIVGATVMPHNLYLHSSIVQTRVVEETESARRKAIRFASLDTFLSLFTAFFVNAAILIVAATAFHVQGRHDITEIADAYKLLEPLVGSSWGSILFGIALLASGQSSTFTGTIAGQVIMEGFLDLKIPCWQRGLITRSLALIPAVIGVAIWSEAATGKILVFSQVVLSCQLPFAIYPLIRMTSNKKLMGPFANRKLMATTAWILFVLITGANLWMIEQIFWA